MPKLKSQFVTSEIEVWSSDAETVSLLSANYLCAKQVDLVMKKAQLQTKFEVFFSVQKQTIK